MTAGQFSGQYDVCVLGGAGHVGLPLSILFAHRGQETLIYDINKTWLGLIAEGKLPFFEEDAEPLLKEVIKTKKLHLSSTISDLARCKVIVITIGTPVDEFLNPTTRLLASCMEDLMPHLHDGQTLVLRSTVSPGVTEWLDRHLKASGKKINVAFCPERVVQGQATKEILTLPQIVSGTSKDAIKIASELFLKLAPEVVEMEPMEAEFAKLFSNAHRYIQFATANQFYMLTTKAGLDFSKIQKGMCHNYPRNQGIPRPGFAAGPCLFKDTMQLAAFSNNQFSIGYDAMAVNEGLPLFLLERIKQKCDLRTKTVGLLGMAFKQDSDDVRSSLSYKIKKNLQMQAKAVLTTDPMVVTDPELLPVEEVIVQSDFLILCTPHSAYKNLNLRGKPIVDVWNFYGNGTLVPEIR